MVRTILRAIAIILNALLLGIVLWETSKGNFRELEGESLLILAVVVLAPSFSLYFLFKPGR